VLERPRDPHRSVRRRCRDAVENVAHGIGAERRHDHQVAVGVPADLEAVEVLGQHAV
jgi:hypothetical protein